MTNTIVTKPEQLLRQPSSPTQSPPNIEERARMYDVSRSCLSALAAQPVVAQQTYYTAPGTCTNIGPSSSQQSVLGPSQLIDSQGAAPSSWDTSSSPTAPEIMPQSGGDPFVRFTTHAAVVSNSLNSPCSTCVTVPNMPHVEVVGARNSRKRVKLHERDSIPGVRNSRKKGSWMEAVRQWEMGDPGGGLHVPLKDWPVECYSGVMREWTGSKRRQREMIAKQFQCLELDPVAFDELHSNARRASAPIKAIHKNQYVKKRGSERRKWLT
ncbi:hypothetical protein D9613_012144 [Agrocybe pediades]|uniref:Uncharacterized protein n=1 Tax=Agrocybe pediades TaxID=84607 RepID=A0A8H4R3I0_9AGAR|nr:hypothetical protein D9613_012144 [Agrocybe pediades]